MRNYSQKNRAASLGRYLIFGGLLLVMTVNDILLGFRVLGDVTIPLLLGTSIFLKVLILIGVALLLYQHRILITRSERDTLTKAYTRDIFFEQLDRLITSQGGNRSLEDISIILFDLDSFKQINDSLGHQIGDRVLVHIGNITHAVIRHDDIFARLGGEEFGILLPRTSVAEAAKLADRLRRNIEENTTRNYRVTASFGVAQWNRDETSSQLYARADALMYKAKYAGKNRVLSA